MRLCSLFRWSTPSDNKDVDNPLEMWHPLHAPDFVHRRHNRRITKNLSEHVPASIVILVHLLQSEPRPIARILNLQPDFLIRRRILSKPVRTAGIHELKLSWEMIVHGGPLDSGTLRNGVDRCPRRPDRLVQMNGGHGDPPTDIFPPTSSGLQRVWPLPGPCAFRAIFVRHSVN